MQNNLAPYQIVTNSKQRNKLGDRDHYYNHIIDKCLEEFKSKNLVTRKNWVKEDFDYYIRMYVGKKLVENEFHTGIEYDSKNSKHILKRKITKKALVSSIAKELELPEIAINFVYDDISDSDCFRTRKEDAKHYVNTSIENSLNELELAVMDSPVTSKAALIKAKTELLKLYLESNQVVAKGQGMTINNVQSSQSTDNSVNQINKIESSQALQELVSKALQLKNQTQPALNSSKDIYMDEA